MMRVEPPYNPLDKKNLSVSVADALLVRSAEPLQLSDPFIGAGIYAIYYVGSFPLYEPIAETHRNGLFNSPIYVGKAVPSGARKGGYGLELSLRNLWKPAQTGRATSSLQTSQNHCPVS